jgi:hypothetical protein
MFTSQIRRYGSDKALRQLDAYKLTSKQEPYFYSRYEDGGYEAAVKTLLTGPASSWSIPHTQDKKPEAK